jgi:periplasmic divalent cation tolerance protein
VSSVTLVLCTAPEGEAASLAEQLLRDRLVACVNLVGPVTSMYVWQGAKEESREVLLIMKTARHLAAALRERIVELHSYEVPEVLEFDADGGLDRYMEWVAGSCER